jgi:hypothetical protein
MAGEPGFEPGLTESESVGLPLTYSPAASARLAATGARYNRPVGAVNPDCAACPVGVDKVAVRFVAVRGGWRVFGGADRIGGYPVNREALDGPQTVQVNVSCRGVAASGEALRA